MGIEVDIDEIRTKLYNEYYSLRWWYVHDPEVVKTCVELLQSQNDDNLRIAIAILNETKGDKKWNQ